MEHNKTASSVTHRILACLLSFLIIIGLGLPVLNSTSLNVFASEEAEIQEQGAEEKEEIKEEAKEEIKKEEGEETTESPEVSDPQEPNVIMGTQDKVTVEEILAQNQSDMLASKSRRQTRGTPAQTITVDLGTLAAGSPYTITKASTGKYDYMFHGGTPMYPLMDKQIIVDPEYKGTVKFNEVNVKYSSSASSSLSLLQIKDNADVVLELIGHSKVWRDGLSFYDTKALIQVEKEGHLTIESSSGVNTDDSLTAIQHLTDGWSGAAIGSQCMNRSSITGTGREPFRSGYITINSGTVYAEGGDDGAGIGGGSASGGGFITINGGIVSGFNDSTGGTGNSGAGIGSGAFSVNKETTIRINGGDVTAVSLIPTARADGGSAIGAGTALNPLEGDFAYLLITGGNIRASVVGKFDGPGGAHQEYALGNMGKDGAAIGGGSRPNASGTIIILPSADISEIYGSKTNSGGGTGQDIGNCTNIFYLNNQDARVTVGTATIQKTKKFTMRTVDNKTDADFYARVNMADQYLPAFASKVGGVNLNGSGHDYYGTPYFYTNGTVDFYSTAKDTAGNYYKVVTYPNSQAVANPTEAYNPGTSDAVFNVILDSDASPTYELAMFGPVDDSGMQLQTPPSNLGFTLVPPTAKADEIDLYFGTRIYNPSKLTPEAGASYTGYNVIKFKLANLGRQNFKFEAVDKSKVSSFELTGPVVAPPAVAGGQHLPAHSEGFVTVTLKNTTRAGNRTGAAEGVGPEQFKITAIQADGTAVVKTINLHINVKQLKVTNLDGANTTARRPVANTAGEIRTNLDKVTIRAKAANPAADGVKGVYYHVSSSPTPPTISAGTAPGSMPGPSDTDWTKVAAIPDPITSLYAFNFDMPNVPLGPTNGNYYIHWYVESENTIGSTGTVGPYIVNRDPIKPIITKDGAQIVNDDAFDAKISFDHKMINLMPGHIEVENGTVLSLTTPPAAHGAEGEIYTFRVQPDGKGDVVIKFREKRVIDVYGDNNLNADNLVLPYSSGVPTADFSSIPDMIHTLEPTLSFKVNSGVSGQPDLFDAAGSPLITANAATSVSVSGPGSHRVSNYSNGEFTLTGPFAEGDYTITINAGDIKNTPGTPIVTTIYNFKVRIPVVEGITVDKDTLLSVGGEVVVTVTGKNLEYANSTNGYTFKIKENGVEFVFNSTGTTAVFNAVLPENFDLTAKTYKYEPTLVHKTAGASVITVSKTVTVGLADPKVTALDVHDDSNINSFYGGTAELKITGVYLNNFATLEVKDDKGKTYPITPHPSVGAKEAFVTVTLDKNTAVTPEVYTFKVYANGVDAGFTATITIVPATPDVTALKVTKDSGHKNGVASLDLEQDAGTVYFVIEGINLHNLDLSLRATGPKALTDLIDGDFTKVGVDKDKANSVGVALEKNREQKDHVYTFEVYKDGVATGKTVTVTVKKPEIGVKSITATPAKHPGVGGSSQIHINGVHMDVAALELKIDSPLVSDYTVVAGDFKNDASDAEFNLTFPPHQQGLRNDIYTLEVYFDGKATGITTEVEVGDSIPNVTGTHAVPSHYPTVQSTAGKLSAIVVEGNYMSNLQSLEIYDKTFDKMYTVNIAGTDRTAQVMVPVPSAIGVYDYVVWVDGVETEHIAKIYVGVTLGDSGDEATFPDYNGPDDEPNKDKEWNGGPGVSHGGGNKGGGFTGPNTVEFDVFIHHSEQAGKQNPQDPRVTIKNVPYVTADQLTQAASAARKGMQSSELAGHGALTIEFDSMLPEKTAEGLYRLEGRLYVSMLATAKSMHTSVYTRSAIVGETVDLFKNKFGLTNVTAVYLAQNGDFGTNVEVAANLDLKGFNTKSLHFYLLNRETGEYKKIAKPNYFIDKGGFLHFDVVTGGTVIVTDSPLSPPFGTLNLPASISKAAPIK